MAADRTACFAVPAAAASLLWPALWNGYPIVFADTGTYLSQAIHQYAGWDRPVFYSVFMWPLHATVTVWPVVVVQALLAAWVLWLVCRVLIPRMSRIAFVGVVIGLSICTWLPWLVCELMPDLFTPLLVLALCLLVQAPERMAASERALLVGMAAFMIASQQSSLPLALALLVLGLTGRVGTGVSSHVSAGYPASGTVETSRSWMAAPSPAMTRRPTRGWLLIVLPPALALLGMSLVNLAAHGRFTISPFGNVFLLARVIYDGPGIAVLRRDCPAAGWRLCPFVDSFPPTSDDFLWTGDSPLNRAGGPEVVSQDADGIIQAALRADPVGEFRSALANTAEQMRRFDSGDGLNPWPAQVSPWIQRDFPVRKQAAYAAARQQLGSLSVPPLLHWIHMAVALGGGVGCAICLPVAFRRRATCAGFLFAVLIARPLSAAITGGLSAPHDRYQARIMWLPPFIALLSFASLDRRLA
jgi:hypothetical protein